jgi:acetyl-CoA carboxylase, biotin carboxylase subunit
MFRRILIANRGEVAARIIRACRKLGIESVAVYSKGDSESPHLEAADLTVCIGPAAGRESYLNMPAILQTALQYDCQAVHPGWGFLAENALFSRLCQQQKTTFIGPPPEVITLMGDKARARETMGRIGLPLIPGSDGIVNTPEEALEVARRVGFPVLFKARSGGGGKGMRISRSESDLREAFQEAHIEAEKAFGDGGLYTEKYIASGRHIEFQILVDAFGGAVHLGERECSVQRNHQKLIEESPSPVVSAEIRREMGERVARAAAAIGYQNAGTVEFLMDESGHLYFMEMNTRLQVEHPVTEMITGCDLVELQIRIAANEPLTLRQEEIVAQGHAVECRINAEDPFQDFRGSPGRIERFEVPPQVEAGTCRLETHVRAGAVIPPYYDSMIGKLIARGDTRESAIATMISALENFHITGVKTTIPLHLEILRNAEFRSGRYDTGLVPKILSGLAEKRSN